MPPASPPGHPLEEKSESPPGYATIFQNWQQGVVLISLAKAEGKGVKPQHALPTLWIREPRGDEVLWPVCRASESSLSPVRL
jgi:hypothetical protein